MYNSTAPLVDKLITTKSGALFDLDGLMVPSLDLWVQTDAEYFKLHGIHIADPDALHREKLQIMKKYTAEPNMWAVVYSEWNKKYGIPLTGERGLAMVMKMVSEKQARLGLKDGVAKTLHRLKSQDFKLGIVTATNRSSLDTYKDKNEIIKKAADFNKIFGENILTTEDFENKTHGYLMMQEMLGLNKEDYIIFEDSPAGVEEAVVTGIDTVAVYDKFWKDDLPQIEQMTPYRINSFEELQI